MNEIDSKSWSSKRIQIIRGFFLLKTTKNKQKRTFISRYHERKIDVYCIIGGGGGGGRFGGGGGGGR